MAATTLLASAARYGSGLGAPVDLGAYAVARLVLTVSAVSQPAGVAVGNLTAGQPRNNPPLLELEVETSSSSDPNASTWRLIHAYVPMTATGEVLKTLSNFDRYVRARWVSRSFTPV